LGSKDFITMEVLWLPLPVFYVFLEVYFEAPNNLKNTFKTWMSAANGGLNK
jgi:hypothetical protein